MFLNFLNSPNFLNCLKIFLNSLNFLSLLNFFKISWCWGNSVYIYFLFSLNLRKFEKPAIIFHIPLEFLGPVRTLFNATCGISEVFIRPSEISCKFIAINLQSIVSFYFFEETILRKSWKNFEITKHHNFRWLILRALMRFGDE